MTLPSLDQLEDVRKKILKDPYAKRALNTLQQAGLRMVFPRAEDSRLRRPEWFDSFVAIPFVSARPSRTLLHLDPKRGKHSSLLTTLRSLADDLDDPFCEVSIFISRAGKPGPDLSRHLRVVADFLEEFLSWDVYVSRQNPRNALIAELRWHIRFCTGKPYDREHSTIIDAAMRAAGKKELRLDNSALNRIEQRAKESRVKATRKLNRRAKLQGWTRINF